MKNITGAEIWFCSFTFSAWNCRILFHWTPSSIESFVVTVYGCLYHTLRDFAAQLTEQVLELNTLKSLKNLCTGRTSRKKGFETQERGREREECCSVVALTRSKRAILENKEPETNIGLLIDNEERDRWKDFCRDEFRFFCCCCCYFLCTTTRNWERACVCVCVKN